MPFTNVPSLDDYLAARQASDAPETSPYAALRADPARPEGRNRPQGGGGFFARLPRAPKFVVGLDLGQANDHTAMCAVEMLKPDSQVESGGQKLSGALAPSGQGHSRYRVPLLTRAPLGTPYPTIVRRVAEIVTAPPLAGACHLVVDATGVGRPVLDMMWSGPLRPIPITITGGDRVHGVGSMWRVPKRDLVAALQLAFQAGRIEIAAGADDAQSLATELADFRVRISASGSDSYGAWGSRTHDDLVLALALAIWWAERLLARERTRNL